MKPMKHRSGITVMARLVGLVKPLTGYMILAILLGLAGHLTASFLTILGGWAILGGLGFSAPASTAGLFVCMGVFALLRGILRYGEQACNHFIAFKLLALIRSKVFQALRRLAPAKLDGRDKGDLISVITSDIELLEVFYAHTISPAAIALLFCTILCLFIGAFHPLLGLLALAAYLTVGVLIPWATSQLSGDLGLRFRRDSGALSAFVLDSLRGLSELLQYQAGQRRLEEMEARSSALSGHEAAMKRVTGRNMAVSGLAILLFGMAMLFASAGLYLSGQVEFDGVLLPTLALLGSFGPTVALANLGSTLQNTFAAGNRVLDILEEQPVAEDLTGRPATQFHTGVNVEDVTFSYGGERVLDHVCVDIPQGQIIGLVGRSGSGKSTLLKLLMRFWPVTQGSITLSGRSIGEINTADLRSMEGFVTQDTHLFHDSIANNLRIAKLDATQEELEEACRKASVHEFIMSLPQGYDTPVGELGDTLSGGERQRLGIARAFLHNAPLLLLDEPTSNLDSLNEAVILQALERERAGRTVVLVSHRASTMAVADRVYCVEHGRLS